MITITQECPRQHLDWLHKSCNFIRILYHPLENAHTFKLAELDAGRFFIVRHHRQIVGCGSIVPYATGVRELKHIFVDATARGLGCGKALLTHLEESAVHDAITKIVLETGTKQPEAIGLYAAFGYQFCESYIASALPHAVFMEKKLDGWKAGHRLTVSRRCLHDADDQRVATHRPRDGGILDRR